MKKILHNFITLLIALVGLVGGIIWGVHSMWDYEPCILILVSCLEILAYFIIPINESEILELPFNPVTNAITQNLNLNINNIGEIQGESKTSEKINNDFGDQSIEVKKNKIGILFIDDDKNFSVVKILKDSGWKNTKSVTDIKSLDINQIKTSEIIFVDINGVGKILKLENEGLDLALMLKQKYGDQKKVIIYSANKKSNTFHEAWDKVDGKLEKNALPYQFQTLVENYSKEYYN